MKTVTTEENGSGLYLVRGRLYQVTVSAYAMVKLYDCDSNSYVWSIPFDKYNDKIEFKTAEEALVKMKEVLENMEGE